MGDGQRLPAFIGTTASSNGNCARTASHDPTSGWRSAPRPSAAVTGSRPSPPPSCFRNLRRESGRGVVGIARVYDRQSHPTNRGVWPAKGGSMRPLSRSFALAFVLGSVTTFILTGVVSTQQAGRQIGDPGGPGTENPNTAYSRNILIGNTLYVAGNTGQVQNTGSIEADVEAEIRNLLESFKGNIEAGGMTMDDLVWVQVFCTDLALYDMFNEIYMSYFSGPLPTRAFIGTSTILGNSHFEIMGTAVSE
ncbi:MAG: hypothetical protein CL476_04400 [Acidobacteria bacterium]|nr:hypothetical protein [Acidobacteriota bacterium]